MFTAHPPRSSRTPGKPRPTSPEAPPLSSHRPAPPCCVQRVATPQYVEVAAHEPERRPRQGSGVTSKSPRSKGTLTQERSLRPPLPPPGGLWTTRSCPQASAPSAFVSPSALSSKVSPGTTRQRANRTPTALHGVGPAPAGSYSGHSPARPHFDHPRTTRGHRSATPAAVGLPRFAVDLVRLVTSVVGCPTGLNTARPPLPGRRSFRRVIRTAISGGRTQKRPPAHR